MSITDETALPSYADLTVRQEINLSTPYLKVVAPYMHIECESLIKDYMLKRIETADPRATIKEAAAVTDCGIAFLQQLKKTCANQTKAFADCADYRSTKLLVSRCRAEQTALDECVERELHIQRPPAGYFSLPKTHDPKDRPKPTVLERDYKAEAAKVLAELPDDALLRRDYKKFSDWRHVWAEQ